ncbi:MAG: aspartate kinase [Oligoflexales bacterium]
MELVVQKYGGSLLTSVSKFADLAEHIRRCHNKKQKIIAVVSAMKGETDRLYSLAYELNPSPPKREVDMLITTGERIAMSLLSIALDKLGISSISLTGSQSGILTDKIHGNARIIKVLGDRIRDCINKVDVVIVAGFQGMNLETKEITTLGRGGTDLTAVAIAHTLKATKCEFYKDVDGIYTADPKTVPNAKVISKLSWDTLTALTWNGASVLHARGAHLAHKFSIPLEIRSGSLLEKKGTIVDSMSNIESSFVSAITHKNNLCLLQLAFRSKEPTKKIASFFWDRGETPIIFQQVQGKSGDTTVNILGSKRNTDDYLQSVTSLASGLRPDILHHVHNLAAITVVGEGFWQAPELVNEIVDIVHDDVVLFESKNTALVFALPSPQLSPTIQRLHEKIFEKSPS